MALKRGLKSKKLSDSLGGLRRLTRKSRDDEDGEQDDSPPRQQQSPQRQPKPHPQQLPPGRWLGSLRKTPPRGPDNVARTAQASPPPPPPPQPRPAAPSSAAPGGADGSVAPSPREERRLRAQQPLADAAESEGAPKQQQQQPRADPEGTRTIESSSNGAAGRRTGDQRVTPAEAMVAKPLDAAVRLRLAAVTRAYGPSANLYTDVLGVSPTATPAQIREAFFCLRYDIYQQLDASTGPPDAKALTSDEREQIEARMDAISAGFQVLSDEERRRAYDLSLRPGGAAGAESSPNNDEEGEADSLSERDSSPASHGAVLGADGPPASSRDSPPRISPSRNDVKPSFGQRRSVFYRRIARHRSGMNRSRQIVAEPVTGGLNERRALRPEEDDGDDIFDGDGGAADGGAADDGAAGKKAANWVDFGDASGKDTSSSRRAEQHDGARGLATAGNDEENEDSHLSEGSNFNAREQAQHIMHRVYLSEQMRREELEHRLQLQTARSDPVEGERPRLGGRYDKPEREDRYANEPSPTGVDGFAPGVTWSQHPRKPSPTATTDSNMTPEEDATLEDTTTVGDTTQGYSVSVTEGTSRADEDDDDVATRSTYDDSRVYDDDTMTYGDETLTYDDGTSCADETTTLGDTVDESTWASESHFDDSSDGVNKFTGKHIPKHKKGTKPQPILRSGSRNGGTVEGKRSDSDTTGKRVTIHSHRGRGDESDDFSLFGDTACPMPSLGDIHEEVTGTYKDFTSALHQVSNAFVIGPDDIDRIADKIRDAKIELVETYERQKEIRDFGGS